MLSSAENTAIYNDFSGLASLKRDAAVNDPEAAKKVAKEFESVFVHMMLKSMREASPEGGLFESDQMEAYQGMFDQQLALSISGGEGIGLAEVIERQLTQGQPTTKPEAVVETAQLTSDLQKIALTQRTVISGRA